MAKKEKDNYVVKKILGELSGSKKVAIISWFDRPDTLDIRKFDGDTPLKGISIELNDLDDLEDAIKKARKQNNKSEDNKKDSRENVNLLDHLSSVSAIVDKRSKGVATVKGGMVEIKLKKKK